jgi:hypothetical protein
MLRVRRGVTMMQITFIYNCSISSSAGGVLSTADRSVVDKAINNNGLPLPQGHCDAISGFLIYHQFGACQQTLRTVFLIGLYRDVPLRSR